MQAKLSRETYFLQVEALSFFNSARQSEVDHLDLRQELANNFHFTSFEEMRPKAKGIIIITTTTSASEMRLPRGRGFRVDGRLCQEKVFSFHVPVDDAPYQHQS